MPVGGEPLCPLEAPSFVLHWGDYLRVYEQRGDIGRGTLVEVCSSKTNRAGGGDDTQEGPGDGEHVEHTDVTGDTCGGTREDTG